PLADVVGLPDQAGGPLDDRHQRPTAPIRLEHLLVVAQRHVGEVTTALGRRLDDRGVDFAQCTLRERREGADAFDLVAEELDAERLASGGREDVDDPATHRELPALLDTLDPLVARERERFRARGDAGLLSTRDAKPRTPRYGP